MPRTSKSRPQPQADSSSAISGVPALSEIIDVPEIQALMDDFHTLTGLVVALLDIEGRVLVAAGWQDICTKFHRVHPETRANCRESDTLLTTGVARGEFRAYTCKNGLTDVVTPLFVGDMHVGNIFSGQFFYDDEAPDMEFFERRAARYGFDPEQYLKAAGSVPRFTHETIDSFMRFYVRLTEQIARTGYSNLVLSETVAELRRVEEALLLEKEYARALIDTASVMIVGLDDTGAIVEFNQAATRITGYVAADLEGRNWFEVLCPRGRYPEVWQEFLRLTAGASPGTFENPILTKSGEERVISWQNSRLPSHSGITGTVSFGTDVTDRARADEAKIRSARSADARLRLVNIASDSTLDTLLEATLEEAEQLTGSEISFHHSVDPDQANITAMNWSARTKVQYCKADRDGTHLPISSAGVWADCIRQATPVVHNDYASLPNKKGLPKGHAPLVRELTVPVIRRGRVVAIVGVGNKHSDYDSHDVEAIERLADLTWDLAERKRVEDSLRTTNQRREALLKNVVRTMGKVVEARDPYTQGHETNVANLAVLIAREMGLSQEEINAIEVGALVHDIGKLSIPTEILTKPGVLTERQFALIKTHPRFGYEILKGIDFGGPVAEIALQHHERVDGSGYPDGLACEEILMAARVVAVADVVEAMASHRPYRAALGLDLAMAEIAGHPEKYDADVAAACCRLYEARRISL